MSSRSQFNPATNALLGVAVGDAIGVPFEFRSRKAMLANPAEDIIGYGTHAQPPGTWSDDTSLTLCLAGVLKNGYDLESIAQSFVDWRFKDLWTARGEVFDIGITTEKSIRHLKDLLAVEDLEEIKNLRYYSDESQNGNGSLMRILPLLFYIKGKPIDEQWVTIWEISALTHNHIRAAMCCLIYLKLAEYLLEGQDKTEAYQNTRRDIAAFWGDLQFAERERIHFARMIQQDIREADMDSLQTSGYVIDSLEASLWFFLQRDNYRDIVIDIINMGEDTDTSAAIAGGLAGLYYGAETIPQQWLSLLARSQEISILGEQLYQRYFRS
jgi:ADP-ribosylglycohydrolase